MSSQAPTHPHPNPALEGDAANRVTAYSWYVLVVLSLGYVSNHIDRGILSILLQPIKEEFGASDLMMGFLTGPAFAVFYTLAGIPIARWADRGSRTTIVALSICVWSVFTALSGIAQGFWTLALYRVGVGTGEAGGSPPSHSLISDYFPMELRAKALGVYAASTQMGAAFGWLLGGWLFLWLGWRLTFVAVGLPGIALAALIWWTVREPERGGMEKAGVSTDHLPMREALRFLRGQRSFAWSQVGGALHAISGYGLGVWVAPFLIRVHGMEIHVLGSWLGLIAITAGVAGMLLGGLVTDRLAPRDHRWFLWVPILSACLSIPFTLTFLYIGEPMWALLAFAVHTLLAMGYSAPIYAMNQAVVKVRARSLAVAIHLFIVNLIGLGLGPVVIGGMNDYLHGTYGDLSIRYTMTVAALTNVIACVFYVLAARTVREDIAERDNR